MDYRSTLQHAMSYNSKHSSVWLGQSNRAACLVADKRAARGPIGTKEISHALTLMPLPYLLQLRPLFADGTCAATLNRRDIDGTQTVYWGFSTLTGTVGTPDTADSAVFLCVRRITINSMQAENVSTWVVTAGAINPATKLWVTRDPVFLDDSHVRRSGSGIDIKSRHVTGSISTTPDGRRFNFSVNFIDTGFEFVVSASSARGFVRPGQNAIASHGILAEARTWSVVDGVVSSEPATAAAGSGSPSNSVVNTLSIRTPGRTIDGFYRYTGGGVWLDIKTIGLQRLSKLNVFLASMFSRSHMYHRRLLVKVQYSGMQLQCLVTDRACVHSIMAHQNTYCRGVVHVWGGGKQQQPQYDLDANIFVKATFPKSHAPSAIDVNIPGIGNFVFTSQAATRPLTPDFNGAYFLSPCHVTRNGATLAAAAAVMEWVPGDLYPQEADAVKISGLWGIQKSWKANLSARAMLSLAFIAIICIYISMIMGIACLLPPFKTRASTVHVSNSPFIREK